MKNPEPMPGHVGCIIRVGKRWVIGFNDRTKTSPAFIKRMPDGEIKNTRHAEAHALQLARRAGGQIKRVVVLRWTKKNKLAMAKPCEHCQELLDAEGIPHGKIFYSTETGKIKR